MTKSSFTAKYSNKSDSVYSHHRHSSPQQQSAASPASNQLIGAQLPRISSAFGRTGGQPEKSLLKSSSPLSSSHEQQVWEDKTFMQFASCLFFCGMSITVPSIAASHPTIFAVQLLVNRCLTSSPLLQHCIITSVHFSRQRSCHYSQHLLYFEHVILLPGFIYTANNFLFMDCGWDLA